MIITLFNELARDLNTKIFLHLISVIIFSFIYYNFFTKDDFFGRDINDTKYFSYLEAFYFSLVTQSTVGFGYLSPKTGKTRVIVILQILMLLFIFSL